jgi:integrase
MNAPDCELIFTTPRGYMWRERTFYRDVWKPTQEASGLDIRPHECRHSYVTQLREAGVGDADLAAITGHSVLLMLSRYAHPLGLSSEAVRAVIG